jgi:hypothetical protein
VHEDLAAFQAEDIHHRLSAGIIGQAVPMTVKDNVVVVSKDTFDLVASVRMIRSDPGNDAVSQSGTPCRGHRDS